MICFDCDKCNGNVVVDNEFMTNHSDLFTSLTGKRYNSLTFATTYAMNEIELVDIKIDGDLNLGSLLCVKLILDDLVIKGDLHLGNSRMISLDFDKVEIDGSIFLDDSEISNIYGDKDMLSKKIKY